MLRLKALLRLQEDSYLPDVAVLGHILKHAVDSLLADGILPAGIFSNDCCLAFLSEPLSRRLKTLDTDGTADALVRSPRVIAVEVLVHLEHELVGGIGKPGEIVIVLGPGPCTAVSVSFWRDPLARCASSADTIDGCLIEIEN